MVYQKHNKLHIVTAVAVIRNRDGKYLILRRREDEIAYPGMYTFPGGKLEDNETIAEALRKEVREEAGLRLRDWKILLKDKSILRPDGQTSKSFSYLCEAENSDEVTISADFTDYRWVSVEELKALPHVGVEEELIMAEKIFGVTYSREPFYVSSVKDDLTMGR